MSPHADRYQGALAVAACLLVLVSVTSGVAVIALVALLAAVEFGHRRR